MTALIDLKQQVPRSPQHAHPLITLLITQQ
jgi:hypothetical protein